MSKKIKFPKRPWISPPSQFEDGGIIPQDMTEINIEKNELLVNPETGKVMRSYTMQRPHADSKSKEPFENFVVAPKGGMIIPTKWAKAYTKGDKTRRDSILRNLQNQESAKQMKDGGPIGNQRDTIYDPRMLQKFPIKNGKYPKYLLQDKTTNFTKKEKEKGILDYVDDVMSAPQRAAVYALTGKYENPSKALGINEEEHPWLAMGTDMILDPTNLLGIGSVTKGVGRVLEKVAGTSAEHLDDLAKLADRAPLDLHKYETATDFGKYVNDYKDLYNSKYKDIYKTFDPSKFKEYKNIISAPISVEEKVSKLNKTGLSLAIINDLIRQSGQYESKDSYKITPVYDDPNADNKTGITKTNKILKIQKFVKPIVKEQTIEKAIPNIGYDSPPWKEKGAISFEPNTTNLSGGKGQYVYYDNNGYPKIITKDEFERQNKMGTPKFQNGGLISKRPSKEELSNMSPALKKLYDIWGNNLRIDTLPYDDKGIRFEDYGKYPSQKLKRLDRINPPDNIEDYVNKTINFMKAGGIVSGTDLGTNIGPPMENGQFVKNTGSNINMNSNLGYAGMATNAISSIPGVKKENPSLSQQAAGYIGPWGSAISSVSQLGTNLTKGSDFGEGIGTTIFDPARNLNTVFSNAPTGDKIGELLLPGYTSYFGKQPKQKDTQKEQQDLMLQTQANQNVVNTLSGLNINKQTDQMNPYRMKDGGKVPSYGNGTSYIDDLYNRSIHPQQGMYPMMNPANLPPNNYSNYGNDLYKERTPFQMAPNAPLNPNDYKTGNQSDFLQPSGGGDDSANNPFNKNRIDPNAIAAGAGVLGNSVGSIYDMIWSRGGKRYDRVNYGQVAPNLINNDSALREVDTSTAYGKENIRKLNPSGGGLLSAYTALAAKRAATKANIIESTNNQNAGILNQNSQYNKGLEMQGMNDTAQNKARSEDIFRKGLRDTGANVMYGVKDYQTSKTNNLYMRMLAAKYGNLPQFQSFMNEQGLIK